MVSPVDVDNAAGNLDELEKSLKAAVTEPKEEDPKEPSAGNPDPQGEGDPLAGTKFEGKSMEDILTSYQNLESLYGRMANDLGTQRKLTDRLLDLKREEDLERNAPEPVKIDSAELLDNPTQALDRMISEREARTEKKLEDRLNSLESMLVQERFVAKHPDYMTVGEDPKFLKWAQSSPLRSAVASRAANGDLDAADALLTEYKSTAKAPKEQQELPLEDGVDEAKKVSLESATPAGDAGSSGKVYRRADLIQLKIERPDVYSDPSFQEEILKAYNEGRVK